MTSTEEKDRLLPFKWGLVVVLPAVIWWVAGTSGIPAAQVNFYTVTFIALLLWAMNLVPDVLPAIALPVAYILSGVGTAKQMMESWASPLGWLMLGSLIIGGAMMRSGLGKRIALWAMHITGGSFHRLLWGILAAGIIIAPFSPSPLGKASILVVVCVGICEALGLKKHSAEAASVMLAGYVAVSAPRGAFLSAASDVILYTGLISKVTGEPITWGMYFVHNFVPVLVYSVLSLLAVIFVLRPKAKLGAKEYVEQEYAALPRFGRSEFKVTVFLALMILIFVTESFHKLNAGWLLLLLGCATALPGIRLTNSDHVQKLPYTAVFFVVGCMCIGSAAEYSGAGKALASLVLPHLQGSELYMLSASYVAGAVLNFLFTPLAALGALTVPLSEAAVGLGLNPVPIIYAFAQGLDQYIFPYEMAALLFFYSLGWVSIKQIILVFSLRFVLGGISLLCVSYPWWKLVGLL